MVIPTMSFRAVMVLSFVAISLSSPPRKRPEYIGCQNNMECGESRCCVLGMDRYSIPHCQALGAVGSACRPKNFESVNVTVGYPDGNYIELTDVHKIMCPCAEGLSCNEQSTCYNPAKVFLV